MIYTADAKHGFQARVVREKINSSVAADDSVDDTVKTSENQKEKKKLTPTTTTTITRINQGKRKKHPTGITYWKYIPPGAVHAARQRRVLHSNNLRRKQSNVLKRVKISHAGRNGGGVVK